MLAWQMGNSTDANHALEPLWQKADEAAKAGDFPGVVFILKSLADKGVWQASARIGELYESGASGFAADQQQALRWFRKAIFDGDDPVAHLGLGRAYYEGNGVDRDYTVALQHFKKASAAGLHAADVYLGLMYYFGVGVPQDVLKAERTFDTPAAAGYPIACFYLARIALSRRSYARFVRLWIKGWLTGARMLRKDPGDQRLLGIAKPTR